MTGLQKESTKTDFLSCVSGLLLIAKCTNCRNRSLQNRMTASRASPLDKEIVQDNELGGNGCYYGHRPGTLEQSGSPRVQTDVITRLTSCFRLQTGGLIQLRSNRVGTVMGANEIFPWGTFSSPTSPPKSSFTTSNNSRIFPRSRH